MPKISEERREERRTEIVEAAARCFRRTGFQRTSMADIIQESGLSAGAIYGYFSGKQEILEAVAGEVIGERMSDIGIDDDGALAVRSPRELARLVISGFRGVDKVPMLVQTWGEGVVDPEIRAIANRIVPRIRGMLQRSLVGWGRQHPERVPADEVDRWALRTASLVIGMAQGFAVQSTLFEQFDADEYIAAAVETLPG